MADAVIIELGSVRTQDRGAFVEHACQGLELDRIGLCWSWDLIPNKQEKKWDSRSLNRKTGKWKVIKNYQKYEFARNAYRVLLTRSRLGMVIWIPKGEASDESRNSAEAEEIYKTLLAAGCKPLEP